MPEIKMTLEEREQVIEHVKNNNELLQLIYDIFVCGGEMGKEDPEIDYDRIQINGCYPGDKVRIRWDMGDYKFSDIAYIGTMPSIGDGEDIEMGCFFHCPLPLNPGGIGQPEGEFISLLSASKNPHIASIKPFKRRD